MKNFFLTLTLLLIASPSWALNAPVILVHGATRDGGYIRASAIVIARYFGNVVPLLTARGIQVHTPDLPMQGVSRHERVLVLQKYIHDTVGNKPVHVIAHSMGGLDVRYLLSTLREANILSLTTIATPHRGTPLADFFNRATSEHNFWYWFPRLLGFNFDRLLYMPETTISAMEQFNKETLDRSDVHYFSVTSKVDSWRQMSPVIWPLDYFTSYGIPGVDPVASDGVVPESSQAWGEVIARVQLDHLGELNYHWLHPSQQAAAEDMYKKIIDRLELLERTSK